MDYKHFVNITFIWWNANRKNISNALRWHDSHSFSSVLLPFAVELSTQPNNHHIFSCSSSFRTHYPFLSYLAVVMRCIYQLAVIFICFVSIVEKIQLVINRIYHQCHFVLMWKRSRSQRFIPKHTDITLLIYWFWISSATYQSEMIVNAIDERCLYMYGVDSMSDLIFAQSLWPAHSKNQSTWFMRKDYNVCARMRCLTDFSPSCRSKSW